MTAYSSSSSQVLSVDSAQTGITSVGTLTSLAVDSVVINGDTIGHSADTDLITLANGSVTFTGSTVIGTADINGGAIDNTAIGATTASTGAFTTISASGVTTITNDTTSTSASTGALKVSGGVGINENLHVGGSATVDTNLVVTGNLTVNGTTTTSLRTYNQQSLDAPNDNMYKIKNLFVLPLHTELRYTKNQGNVYFPDVYSISNKSLNPSGSSVVNRAIIDNDVFSLVNPTYDTEESGSQTNGKEARFGVKILTTGLYKMSYIYNVENEAEDDRLVIQVGLAILHTTSQSEVNTLLNSSISREYVRDDSRGQYGNCSGSCYVEVNNDMMESDNGVFVKVEVKMSKESGNNSEQLKDNCNNIRISYGRLEIQKIAELAV